ncbi:MAG: hypothetical protein NTU69_08730 [Proteobacteria bacterium]|nr:hypothetical protein [Pseudomonadota bacterium]
MKKGDKVKFTFAKKEMEGQVEKVFQKTVYIKASFSKDKDKIVKRKIKDILYPAFTDNNPARP